MKSPDISNNAWYELDSEDFDNFTNLENYNDSVDFIADYKLTKQNFISKSNKSYNTVLLLFQNLASISLIQWLGGLTLKFRNKTNSTFI